MTHDEYNALSDEEQMIYALGCAEKVMEQADAVLGPDGAWIDLHPEQEPLRGFGEEGEAFD